MFVSRNPFRRARGAWVGLDDFAADNTFVWVDGVLGSDANILWDVGEPNNYIGDNEDCGMLWDTNTLTRMTATVLQKITVYAKSQFNLNQVRMLCLTEMQFHKKLSACKQYMNPCPNI